MSTKKSKKADAHVGTNDMVKRSEANKLGELLLNFVNVIALFIGAVWFPLTKYIGLANISIPPHFSIGVWFDDTFVGTSLALVFILVWNSGSFYFSNDRKSMLAVCAAVYTIVALSCFLTVGYVKGYSYWVVIAISAIMAAVNFVAFGRYIADDSEKKKMAHAPLARTYVTAVAVFTIGAAVLRVLFGVDELSQMPSQAQLTAAVPIVGLVMAVVLASVQSCDVQVLRALMQVCLFITAAASLPGNIKKSFFTFIFVWVARAAFCIGMYIYAQAPLVNAVVNGYRRAIGKLVKVGNMDGYSDE